MRNARGQFAPGNEGGPGRPAKETEQDYVDAVRRAVSASDLAAVLKALCAKARKGDVAAARVLLPYLLGSPDTAAARISPVSASANDRYRSMTDAELEAELVLCLPPNWGHIGAPEQTSDVVE